MGIRKCKVMEVGPELAKQYLGDIYSQQRPHHSSYTDAYAKDMLNGLWNDNNPSPIVFADTKEGPKLIDGQHRLRAIIKANMTIQVLVVWVEDVAGYKFMDIGHARKASDLISADIPNKTVVCSIAVRNEAIEQGMAFRKSISGNAGITTPETVRYVEENRDYVIYLSRASMRIRDIVGCGAQSSYGAVLNIVENIYGEGSANAVEAALRNNSDLTKNFTVRINALYGGRSSPRAEVTAWMFAEYVREVLTGKRASERFTKGVNVLREWEQEYEFDKEKSDFYSERNKRRLLNAA